MEDASVGSAEVALRRELARVDALLAARGAIADEERPYLPGLLRMVAVYGLSAFDRDLLLVAAAPELDARYVERCPATLGALLNLLIDAYGLPRGGALSRTGREAPLVKNALLASDGAPSAKATITVPSPVWRRMLGIDGGCAFELVARHALSGLVLDDDTRSRFDRAVSLAEALEKRAMKLPAGSDLAITLREARWFDAIPIVAESTDLGVLVGELGYAIVIANQRSVVVEADLPVVELDISAPARPQREQLWSRALGVPPARVGTIVERKLGPGRIIAAARRARDLAATRGGEPVDHLGVACRLVSVDDVGSGADHVEARFGLDDLVVPAATRRELDLAIAWARQLERIGKRTGAHFATAAGLACLFWGPPGTGKSSAAQVLARELGLELFRVDLSRVVDKYVGETEKHLSRIFDQAEANHFVLLFDEADALFGRRTEVDDAHDRFANIETSYLLQRLEVHRGVTVLATNLRSNLDPAFLRRLQITAEFPLPGPAERVELWRRLLPSPLAQNVDLELLAARFPLAGGDLRNAVLAAIVLAGDEPIEMRHLIIGLWREHSRSGRLVDGNEFGPWQHDLKIWLGR
ncbi:MAG: ATP-binding protein [Kofleriaceae bacterium]